MITYQTPIPLTTSGPARDGVQILRSNRKLILVGASVRPWVASAVRAGWEPIAFDRFADWDTRRWIESTRGSVTPIASYASVLTLPEFDPELPLLLAGGIELDENFLPAAQAGIHSPPEALAVVRNRGHLLREARAAGVAVPEIRSSPNGRRRWLWKPNRGCGGQGIVEHAEADLGQPVPEDGYFQAHQAGPSYSASFWTDASGDTGLLGITRQWTGADPLGVLAGAAEFAYAGSFGPLPLTTESIHEWKRIARKLHTCCPLAGPWSIDAICDDRQRWLVDVNSRLTASMELLDVHLGRTVPTSSGLLGSLLDPVRSAGELERTLASNPIPALEGKLVLYHQGAQALIMTDRLADLWQRQALPRSAGVEPAVDHLADLPDCGESILPGHPILTIRVSQRWEDQPLGNMEQQVADALRQRIAQCRQDIQRWGASERLSASRAHSG